MITAVRAATTVSQRGAVNGPIRLADGKLILEQGGKITGSISADRIEVGGDVTGNVVAKDRLEIKATGAIVGDVTAPRMG